MKALLWTILIIVILALCALPGQEAQSAPGEIPINPAAFMPWKAQEIYTAHTPEYISVAWGKTNTRPQINYPLVSYTQDDGTNDIWFMHPADVYVGDCGPDTAWNCSTLEADADATTISQMQTYAFYNTFKVGWVYEDRVLRQNRLHTLELTQRMENAGGSDVLVMDFEKFDRPGHYYSQFGPASIAFDEYGNLHMAVVLGHGGSRLLVYAHKINTAPSTPCNSEANTRYQCDIIWETSAPSYIFHKPKLVLTADNQPRISWFNFSPDSLMYAYPQSRQLLHPNCGPGGDTWRCITIKDSTSDLNFYPAGKMPLMDMAIGPGSPQMLIEAWDSTGKARFVWAKYIGDEGNCGEDYILTGGFPQTALVFRWYCVWNVWDPNVDNPAYDDFALKVDALDNPIIALNQIKNYAFKIGVLYYSERRGLPPGNWYFDVADGNEPTGRGVSMAIGTNDRLLLGYAKAAYLDDDLRIAIQDVYLNFIPRVRR